MVYRDCPVRLQPSRVKPVVWTLADTILKLRKVHGLSRKKLAKKARVSYTTITRLEQERPMKEDSIRKIADGFNLSQADLYALIPPTVDAKLRECLSLWRRLNDDDRAHDVVLETMRRLLTDPPSAAPASAAPAPMPESAPERPERGKQSRKQ